MTFAWQTNHVASTISECLAPLKEIKMRFKSFILICLGLILIQACGRNTPPETADSEENSLDLATLPKTIDVQTAASIMDHEEVVMIDVREQWEYDEGHIPGITLIPMSELETRLAEIPTDKTVVLTCRSGNRSGQVHAFLEQNGYDNTVNMDGGILAWEAAGLDVEQ